LITHLHMEPKISEVNQVATGPGIVQALSKMSSHLAQ
jgi:hypothetical protein